MISRLPSLRLSIPLLILAVGLLLVAATLAIESRRSGEQVRAELVREARRDLILLSASVEASLRNRNPAAARSILAHATSGADLVLASVVAADGRVLHSSRLVEQGRMLSQTGLAGHVERLTRSGLQGDGGIVALDGGRELLAHQSLLLPGRADELLGDSQGQLALVYDLGPRLRASRKALVRRVGLAGLMVLAITLALWAGMHRLVIRRLAALETEVGRVAEGETELPVLPGRDELARLSAAISRMARQVGESRDSQAEEARRSVQLKEQLHRVQRLESVGTLAAGVAHDFNNLLTVVLGHAQLAEGRVGNPAATDDDLAQVREAARRGRDVVQQLLDLSRERQAEKGLVELGTVVEGALELARSSFPSRVRVVERSAGVPLLILANEGQLQQVVINLLTNALQAIGPGTGKIELRLERIDVDGGGHRARLVVADDGPGMGPEVASRVFEPFFTTRAADKGTGLGLAVVRGIVEAHGGTIRVESEAGAGSSFTVEFPFHSGEGTIAPEEERAGTTRRALRIVFVDDEAPVLAVLCRLARSLGHEAVGFADPLQAQAALRGDELDCDLLVSDYMMPGLDGQELIRSATGARPGLDAILVSGYGNLLSAPAAREAGAIAVVLKPDFVRDMEGVLREVLPDSGVA